MGYKLLDLKNCGLNPDATLDPQWAAVKQSQSKF